VITSSQVREIALSVLSNEAFRATPEQAADAIARMVMAIASVDDDTIVTIRVSQTGEKTRWRVQSQRGHVVTLCRVGDPDCLMAQTIQSLGECVVGGTQALARAIHAVENPR